MWTNIPPNEAPQNILYKQTIRCRVLNLQRFVPGTLIGISHYFYYHTFWKILNACHREVFILVSLEEKSFFVMSLFLY